MTGGVALHCEVADAVRNVHVALDVAPGSRVALVGRNGSGKSTVLTTVAGLRTGERHFSARIRVGERDVSALAPHHRSVVLLSQRPPLFTHMSVERNVMFGPLSRGVPREKARKTAHFLLETMDIADLARRAAAHLSGGQAQKVALAQALAADPEVLMLDEPLAALDVDAAEDMRSLVSDLCAGRTIIFATHDVLDIGAWAERVIHLEGGRTLWDGSSADFFAHPANDFLASLTGRTWVRGEMAAGGIFVSAGGVRLPVVADTRVRGTVRALVDPHALALLPAPCADGGLGGHSEAGAGVEQPILPDADVTHRVRGLGRLGASTVAWVEDVPVYVPVQQITKVTQLAQARVRATVPVPVERYEPQGPPKPE